MGKRTEVLQASCLRRIPHEGGGFPHHLAGRRGCSPTLVSAAPGPRDVLAWR